ncbi:MAG: hypothetical protein WC346_08395 [Methanogenium sp.]
MNNCLGCGKGGEEKMRNVLLRHKNISIDGTKWFKALPTFNGVEHSYMGKIYKFYTSKATEAPAKFIIHKNTIIEVEAPKVEIPKETVKVDYKPKSIKEEKSDN